MKETDSEEVRKILCPTCEKRMDCLLDPLPHHVVYVGDQPCCVGVTALTVLLPSAEIWQRIKVPGALEIASPETEQLSDQMTQESLDKWFEVGGEELFDMVFSSQDIKAPKTINELRIAGGGVKHIVGMIAMIFVGLSTNKRIFLQFPETHLHPKACAGLADMLHYLTNLGKEDEGGGENLTQEKEE